MDGLKDNAIEAILEQLIKEGPNGVAPAFASLFELAMQIERERFLGAGHYERTDDRRGYANGYKPRRWVVEQTFAWLGRNRRLAKDFEQTIASATAWLFIASIQLFARRIARA